MNNLPPPIQVTAGGGSGNSKSDDDPLFEAKINNPFSKFFNWIKNFLKRNQNITIKIPIIAVLMALSGLGVGFNWGFNAALSKFFPNSSPVFHRAISVEGIVQKSNSQKYYLKSADNMWSLKPKSQAINLTDYLNKQVTIKGNLTKEANLVEVAEVIPLDSFPQTSLAPRSLGEVGSNPSSSAGLPDLYPSLQWETTQKRVLIFTSGKRKIEQEGVYLESAQVSAFPQDFINYYLGEFKDRGFKETLNSIDPEGITITYAKDNLFLTFGTENIYSGSKDQKQLVGYKAFVEHN